MTVIDACVQVLESTNREMTVAEIFDEISIRGLYLFKAKDPKAIVGGAIRTDLKNSQPRLREVRKGVFGLTR